MSTLPRTDGSRIPEQLMSPAPACEPADRAGFVRDLLQRGDREGVEDVAVCSENGLEGVVPLRRLLAAPYDVPVSDLMDRDPPVVGPGFDDLETAAWKAVRHGETSLVVLDSAGRLCGMVAPARLLTLLLEAHDQDVGRLQTFLESTRVARQAAEESVRNRLRHRFWWLLLGLLGAGASAWLVGLFGNGLEQDVRLAFFIPGVVYLADAVGTQTEAVMVRGLSVGAPVRLALRRETLTGPAIGLVVSAVSLPAVWWALGEFWIAFAVSVALLAACSVSTLVAAAIPVVVNRAGGDPAFVSGPLATVIQDLLTLLIYFLSALLATRIWG